MSKSELHNAVREGNAQLVAKLAKSSNINTKESDTGQTPLHFACSNSHIEIVKTLLKKKPNINEKDKNGWTALHCACSSATPEIVSLLLKESGTDVIAQTVDGATPFHYLVRQLPPEGQEEIYNEVLKGMVDKEPVHLFANNIGEFPQHFAALKKNIPCLKFLISSNLFLPPLTTRKGETALHYAVMSGDPETVRQVLQVEAEKYMYCETKGGKDSTPYALAKHLKLTEVAEILADIKLPALHTSVRNGKHNSVSMFVKGGQNVNSPDRNGLTPLHHALTLPSLEATEILLKAKEISAAAVDSLGHSVWHMWGNNHSLEAKEDVFNLIWEKDGKNVVNQQNSFGETALHLASLHGNVSLVKMFLDHEVDPNKVTSRDETALHYAVIGRHPAVVSLLLESKIDFEKESKALTYGSAFDLAEKMEQTEIMETMSNILGAAALRGKKRDKKKEKEEKERKLKEEKEEKERKLKEEKERKAKEKEEKRQRRDTQRRETSVKISDPSQVRHSVHVTKDMEWSGGDISEIFELDHKVGEGAFGSVYKAHHHTTGFIVAIKTIPAGDTPEEFEKEIGILKTCRDLNIVSYFGCSIKDNLLWIIMEFCGCGSVGDLIKSLKQEERFLNEDQIAALTQYVVKGLMYLHARGIIHRDLKPANILLNASGEAKLADFGVSAQLNQTLQKARTTIGTPLYMSPEVIEGEDYDFKADIWSLGISVIEMAQNKLPFADMNVMRAIGMIATGPPPTVDEPDRFSDDFKSFVAECCIKDPKDRKSAAQLLAHPFLASRMLQDNRKVIHDFLQTLYPDLDSMDSSASLRSSSSSDVSASPSPQTSKLEVTGSPMTRNVTVKPASPRVSGTVKDAAALFESGGSTTSRLSPSGTATHRRTPSTGNPAPSPRPLSRIESGTDQVLVDTLKAHLKDTQEKLEAEKQAHILTQKKMREEVERLKKEIDNWKQKCSQLESRGVTK